jgi:hypothetical protein
MPSLYILTHVISCREASRLISLRQDRPLDWRERIKLRAHLFLCDVCTRFDRQVAFMREAMRRYRA